MLSNLVRIIQKISSTTTLRMLLSTLKLWFYFLNSTHSSPLPKDNFQKCISFICHPRRLYTCLGTEVFGFPWRVIFGGFSAEDEQKHKLVSAHPQIPLWYEKYVLDWNTIFYIIVLDNVIMIFRTVWGTRFWISL